MEMVRYSNQSESIQPVAEILKYAAEHGHSSWADKYLLILFS